MKRRIKRDFRQMRSPARFVTFCKQVRHALTDNPNLPASVSGVVQEFFEKEEILDGAYHRGLDGGRTAIRERDRVIEEVVLILEQLSSALEAAFVLDPDALFTTGFTITQERRKSTRVTLPLTSPHDFIVVNAPEQGRAHASASKQPGALNCEIHINQKDPSLEEHWYHKSIYPNSLSMILENLVAGNTFVRMRFHGVDGPGPWSSIVSLMIT